MGSRVGRVTWYRFRTTLAARRGGFLALALLIALVGGVALTSIAAARRTQSSYPRFLASTNPSALNIQTASVDPAHPAVPGYDASTVALIRRLPLVKQVKTYAELNAYPLTAKGTLENVSVNTFGSVDGLFFDQDRIVITKGRRSDPTNPHEIVMAAGVADYFHLHVGSVVEWAFYANTSNPQPGIAVTAEKPYLRSKLTLVGVGVLNTSVVVDDVDTGDSLFILFTPALTRQLTACCAQESKSAVQLVHGTRDLAAVEREIARLKPGSPRFGLISVVIAKAERAIKPDAIALGAFGLIAGVGALVIAGQMIGRQLRLGANDREVLRALGASRTMNAGDGLIGVVGAVALGCVLAGVVASLFSFLGPIGPVRHLYPSPGIALDWTTLGVGASVLFLALTSYAIAVAVVAARRASNKRDYLSARRGRGGRRGSRSALAASEAGLPAPAVSGIHFALDPGGGPGRVPVRSAIFGATLAVGVLVSTLTFGASLHALVTHPPLYGWNWDYALVGGGNVGAVPRQRATQLLRADRDVEAFTGFYFGILPIGSETVPVMAGPVDPTVGPPLLSGHGLTGPDQVVLGATTLAGLHKHVGDMVDVQGLSRPTRLRIVGTATMPTIGVGGGGGGHLTMGEGALISDGLLSTQDKDITGNVPTGPEAVLVRVRRGANAAAARRGLERIAQDLSLPSNYGVTVESVQRPAEIVNDRSMTKTPQYLAGGLALAALAGLALTLTASVRGRRRELALLRTLGFTRGQVRAVIAVQSTVVVGIGAVVGVPLGIGVGRVLWDLFAGEIHAVPHPVVPSATVGAVAIAAFVLANVVAAFPARAAANTHPAELLHSE